MGSNNTCTVEPRLTVTSLIRSPHHYGHSCSVPNCIPQCNLAPCNTVNSPLRSLLPSHVGHRIREVPLYIYIIILRKTACLSLFANCRSQFLLDRLGRSTVIASSHESASQFGLANFLYAKITQKPSRKPSGRTSVQ